MKIKCLGNDGLALPDRFYEMGYTSETVFDIVVGETHSVYGMCYFKGVLEYLIVDSKSVPSWYPAVLFQIVDGTLPSCWHFGTSQDQDEVNAVWGYQELVESAEHFDELSEGKESARVVFRKRQEEADSEFVGS